MPCDSIHHMCSVFFSFDDNFSVCVAFVVTNFCVGSSHSLPLHHCNRSFHHSQEGSCWYLSHSSCEVTVAESTTSANISSSSSIIFDFSAIASLIRSFSTWMQSLSTFSRHACPKLRRAVKRRENIFQHFHHFIPSTFSSVQHAL